MRRLKTALEGATYRQKVLALAVCLPIAVMGAKCDPGATITCPPLKNYSQEQQNRMADQYEKIEQLNIAPDLLAFVNDHVDVRDAIKKCIKRRDSKKK